MRAYGGGRETEQLSCSATAQGGARTRGDFPTRTRDPGRHGARKCRRTRQSVRARSAHAGLRSVRRFGARAEGAGALLACRRGWPGDVERLVRAVPDSRHSELQEIRVVPRSAIIEPAGWRTEPPAKGALTGISTRGEATAILQNPIRFQQSMCLDVVLVRHRTEIQRAIRLRHPARQPRSQMDCLDAHPSQAFTCRVGGQSCHRAFHFNGRTGSIRIQKSPPAAVRSNRQQIQE
jgi:hypothetical protein